MVQDSNQLYYLCWEVTQKPDINGCGIVPLSRQIAEASAREMYREHGSLYTYFLVAAEAGQKDLNSPALKREKIHPPVGTKLDIKATDKSKVYRVKEIQWIPQPHPMKP